MSKFRIYRIDHPDPPAIGRRKRIIAGIYAISSPIFVVTFNILLNSLDIETYKVMIFFVFPFLVLYLGLFMKLRSDNRKIKTIGEIEFTQTGINKRIGDSSFSYPFTSINKLVIQKHIPAVTTRESKSGFFSYILGITFNNSQQENLIVSDRPVDKKGNLSISETIKTLKKITPLNIETLI
jgi:hypothetical protein